MILNKFLSSKIFNGFIYFFAGPRIFLQCPLSVEQSMDWFIRLYNSNIVPYMVRLVRENPSIEWKDPTQYVTEIWPWFEGAGAYSVLHTISSELEKPSSRNSSSTSSVGGIDAIYALDRCAISQTKQLQVRP